MTGSQKNSGRAGSVPGGLALGAAVSASMTAAGTLLLAWMLNREVVKWEQIGYGILCMIMLSSYLGAKVSYGRIRRQRMMICVMSGGVYFAVLLSVTALFFGGQYEAVGVTALLVAGGCICAALPGGDRKRAGGRRRVRKHNW